jgi:hypothetical protein
VSGYLITPLRGSLALAFALLLGGPAVLLAQQLNPFEEPQPVEDPLPLAVGNAWTYTGDVWWAPPDSRTVYRENVKWKMEITDIVERDGLRAAVIKGHPQDLMLYEEGREQGDYLLIATDSGKYYLLDGERAAAALKQVRDPNNPLIDLVADPDLVLDLPLFVGKRFCSAKELLRPDKLNCWTVSNEQITTLPGIAGVIATEETTTYLLTHRTSANHAIWNFVPGVGFTSFSFGTRGEPSAVELMLFKVELQTGDDDSMAADEAAGESVTGPTNTPPQ